MIIDSIQDWRDPNEEHRLNGAESDYYPGLPGPYRSKNADFERGRAAAGAGDHPGDPLRPSRTPGLAEYLTVWGTGAVNVNTASPVVLRALGLAPPRWTSSCDGARTSI